MIVVDVRAIERVLMFFKSINNTDLEDITWVMDDEVLSPSKEDIENFKFMGLSNRDFPSIMGWFNEDVGIKIATMRLSKYDT